MHAKPPVTPSWQIDVVDAQDREVRHIIPREYGLRIEGVARQSVQGLGLPSLHQLALALGRNPSHLNALPPHLLVGQREVRLIGRRLLRFGPIWIALPMRKSGS